MSVRADGRVPFVDGDTLNAPQSDQIVHIFVDADDNDELKGIDSLGNIRNFVTSVEAENIILDAPVP